VAAKMKWANLDMENDEICLKMQQKSDAIKKMSTQVTQMELELVKTKQQLGEALNQIQELSIE
jgi:phage-related tail protein